MRRLRKPIRTALLLTASLLLVQCKQYENPDEHAFDKTITTQQPQPCSTSSVKSYMDVGTISSTTSDQYSYIQQYMHLTDTWFLMHNETQRIGVALGTHFGPIGTEVDFTLSSGLTIRTVKVEHKDDAHTIEGCEHYIDQSVIEFVINSSAPFMLENTASNGYVFSGNFNNYTQYEGAIIAYTIH